MVTEHQAHECCSCFTHNNLPCCHAGHVDAVEAQSDVELIRSLVGAWDCCGTCAGGLLARRDRLRDKKRSQTQSARIGAVADLIENPATQRPGMQRRRQWADLLRKFATQDPS